MSGEGYCHFNENGGASRFSVSLGSRDFSLVQNPGSRTLGHGAVVWDASVVFAKYLIEASAGQRGEFDPAKLAGKTVLELGAGCGLAGIALMLRGAQVTFTDMAKVVESLTEKNVMAVYTQLKLEMDTERNGGLHVSTELLRPDVVPIDWTDENNNLGRTFDYILLTDCVFSEELTNNLVRTIRSHCHSKTTVIVCHEIRDANANAAFEERMATYFRLKKIPRRNLHPEYSSEFIELFLAKSGKATLAE